MSKTDQEIFALIRESSDPKKVAQHMISLCLDYLRTHGPSQETASFAPQESA
jgi:hypothetical protein